MPQINCDEVKGMLNGVLKVRVVKGEGSIIMVRGKRKLGYDFDADIPVKNGSIILEEICDHEEDSANIKFNG